ncbi:putative signal transducing protein [Tenacibaculum pelagium]|nr:DUF2007 domain-containing protein [Tenacibaculum pelagium]
MTDYTKFFTGTSIFVDRLDYLLKEVSIPTLIKNHHKSAILSGFGQSMDSVELFIYTSDIEKATPILENFKKEISE